MMNSFYARALQLSELQISRFASLCGKLPVVCVCEKVLGQNIC